MWKIQININLTDDEYTEEKRQIQVEIEESLPDGLKDLDQWEMDVRRIGFQCTDERKLVVRKAECAFPVSVISPAMRIQQYWAVVCMQKL
jgi:hypothetical protein